MNTNFGIFASPKQHSLFPMTIPCPYISKEDYHIFYRHERRLFTYMLVILCHEVVQSTLVVGFLIWLEREGYTSKNLVQITVDSSSLANIDLVIGEVIICLKCIEKKGNKFSFEGSSNKNDIALLKYLSDRKTICLQDLHTNRDCIFDEVSCIAKDVCVKAFDDILNHFKRYDTTSTMALPMKAIDGVGVKGSNHSGSTFPFSSNDFNNHFGFYPKSSFVAQQNKPIVANGGMLNSTIDFGKLKDVHWKIPSTITQQENETSPDDRTIFLTFSKGYPISENEVRDYFTSYFGDFIETIYMHDVGQEEQPLYARIVACSHSMVKAIVERDGPHGKSKYNINGKHVWARKYVKKKPVKMSPATSSEVIAPPQP